MKRINFIRSVPREVFPDSFFRSPPTPPFLNPLKKNFEVSAVFAEIRVPLLFSIQTQTSPRLEASLVGGIVFRNAGFRERQREEIRW